MFAVVFEVKPRHGLRDEYLRNAGLLRPELVAIEGFMANERYSSLGRPGWLVSLSIWRDEKAVIRWRTHALHHEIQGKGRDSVFADYHLRVGEIVADTQPDPDTVLAQQRFDSTEAGAAKALSLTERPIERTDSVSRTPPGLVECDSFDSITRPGNGLYVNSWRDLAAAEAGILSLPGRHRVMRVIRDYGMFARAEAPQYFPPTRPTAETAAGDRPPGREENL
jgi:heme-degrading monooxygenase HmoA